MPDTPITDNYKKHSHGNPLQQYLIGRFYNQMFDLLRPLEVDSILDVGSGEGTTLNKLQKQKIGKRLEGLEYLDTAIKIGRKLYPKLKLKQGTIFDLPYKDNSFDLLLCMEVLEHIENPETAIPELHRVTSKYLLVSVPNEPFFMMSNFMRGKNLERWGNDIEHINHWSATGIEKLIKNSGFKILTRKNPFPWTMILAEKE